MSKGKQDKKRYFIAKSSRTGKPVIGRITQLRNTKGLLLTCNTGKESLCRSEAFRLLDKYVEQEAIVVSSDDEEQIDPELAKGSLSEQQEEQTSQQKESAQEQLTMDKEIAMEIASLKRKREEIKKLHVSVDTGVKGLVFILFTSKKEDPVKAAEFMIDQLCPEDGQPRKAKNVERIIPIEKTCEATLEEIEKNAEELIKRKFGENIDPQSAFSCGIQYRARYNTELSRFDVIPKVTAKLPKEIKVNYKTPTHLIVIEIFQKTCGMSVVRVCEGGARCGFSTRGRSRLVRITQSDTNKTENQTEKEVEKSEEMTHKCESESKIHSEQEKEKESITEQTKTERENKNE